MIRGWLKAGVIEAGKGYSRRPGGNPPGRRDFSPFLLNVALHGLEEAAGVRYQASGTNAGDTGPGIPVAVRYADDVVGCCHIQEQADQVKARLAEWLAPRGLAFNEDKTKIVHLTEGFDFLGFNVRRYPNGKLLIKPCKRGRQAAPRKARGRDAHPARRERGGGHRQAHPVVRGWAAYYRGVVSSQVFGALDDYMWKLTWKWATRTHSEKPKRWVAGRYFGKFNKFRNDRWVFGDRAGADSAAASRTWSSSPGLPSAGICWSPARHLPMTRTWPDTGPNGGGG